MADWKRLYLLTAPSYGIITFPLPLQQNQRIEKGDILGYVSPSDLKLYAKTLLSQKEFGKIDTGMRVQLRLDAYPYQKIGFILGKLSYISNTFSDNGCLAIITLDQGLETNLHKHLQYKIGLKAVALIITKNMRLSDRIYYNIMKGINIGK